MHLSLSLSLIHTHTNPSLTHPCLLHPLLQVHNFKTAHFAVPGTAIVVEELRNRKRAEDRGRFEGEMEARTFRRRHKVKVKRETAKIRAETELATMIGVPMETAEAILHEKEDCLHNKRGTGDTQKEIDAFFRNVKSGNWKYISYALTVGYRGIDVVDKNEDTPIQHAVRLGDVQTVKELLKFAAQPNSKNIWGMSCHHEAWSFWKFHATRSKEERYVCVFSPSLSPSPSLSLPFTQYTYPHHLHLLLYIYI